MWNAQADWSELVREFHCWKMPKVFTYKLLWEPDVPEKHVCIDASHYMHNQYIIFH
jgi:hypothetical protein